MFNPQARWDRNLPGDSGQDGESVEVVARFLKGRITPLYFVLKQRRCDVWRVNYSWTERKGKSLVYLFSVSDKSDNFCLRLDAEAMAWRLFTC